MTATRVDHRRLPGVTAVRTVALDGELRRDDVLVDGAYVGQVVYVRRRRARGGSVYGWRPARSAPQSALTSRVDAIRKVTAR